MAASKYRASSIEKLPFQEASFECREDVHHLRISYKFKVSSMNTAEMENIAYDNVVKRLMRAFAPDCSKDAILDKASLFEASSNGKWWPIAVPFLASVSSIIATHVDATIKSFRPQKKLNRCTLECESAEEPTAEEPTAKEPTEEALTMSEISKRDEEEEKELTAIWDEHIYS